MASVLDVAAYILATAGPMSAMKLQKLVYYSQAWHLAWEDEAMFDDEIQAWANGPVAPRLYEAHRGQFKVESIHGGDFTKLTASQKEGIDIVLRDYGDKGTQWLSDLVQLEGPWRNARTGLPDGERGRSEITHAAMAEYYGGL